MNRKMNTFDDGFFRSVRSMLAESDFHKGYAPRSESDWSLWNVDYQQCSLTFPDADILYAPRRVLGWPYRATSNSERGASRWELIEMLEGLLG